MDVLVQSGVEWESWQALAAAVIGYFGGVTVLTGSYNYVKDFLGLKNKAAMIGFPIYNILIAALVAIADGVIVQADFADPVNLIALVLTATTAGYEDYKRKPKRK